MCVAKEVRLYSNIVLSGGSTAFQHFKETETCLVDVVTLIRLCRVHCAMMVIFQAYNLYNNGSPLFWDLISQVIPFFYQAIFKGIYSQFVPFIYNWQGGFTRSCVYHFDVGARNCWYEWFGSVVVITPQIPHF